MSGYLSSFRSIVVSSDILYSFRFPPFESENFNLDLVLAVP
jgi:hypothetical protein